MLPKNLKLFFADVIDEDTNEQYFYYVVGRNEDSAFNRFKKFANKHFYRYAYYFYEIEDEDRIENFIERNNEIRAGIYEK